MLRLLVLAAAARAMLSVLVVAAALNEERAGAVHSPSRLVHVPDIAERLDVNVMVLVDERNAFLGRAEGGATEVRGELGELDRLAHHHNDGLAMRHDAEAVVEEAAAIKDRRGEAQALAHLLLQLTSPGVRWVVHGVKDVVLAKAQHWHEIGPVVQSHADKAFPAQSEAVRTRLGVERFGGSTNDQHDRASRAPREDLVARALRRGAETHGKQNLPDPGAPKVDLKGEKTQVNAGELAREAGGVGGKVAESADADDAVRVIGKDILAVGVEVGRLDEAEREVVGKVAPEFPVADEGSATAVLSALVPVHDE
mmetsp:Transcript_20986/g.66852  ORF Transcript_20986/g.66852 Transcript_20986/m.66852 type:complete len:311 (+) Transcript_20986:211-1143(+)